MRLVCPSCFATHSIEAWQNEPDARRVVEVITTIPGIVQPRVLPYLGLFRQGERGLSWKRALKIVTELRDAIASGSIQWDRGEARPAPPQLWAETLDAVIARRPEKLDGHNYLRKVVWSNAAPLAAKAERDREQPLHGRSHVSHPEPPEQGKQGQYDPAVSAMMRDFIKKFQGGDKSQ